MKPRNAFSKLIQKVKYSGNLLRRFLSLINDPKQTYFPDEELKNKWAIWRDNVLWVLRHKEINRYYYVYGLDRKSSDNGNEIVGYRTFRSLRDKGNLHPDTVNFNYASLLRDKFIFGQLLSSLHFPTPKNIALLEHAELTWLESMKTVSLSSITQGTQATIDGFCKMLTGIKGEGAFHLLITGNKIYSGNTELSADQLHQKITGQYLLQERISQHPAMSRLHPYSVNTIRMITFNNQGKIEVFCATQRIGAKNRSVDNWASGGIVVGIDLETGTLRREGLFKPGYGGRVEAHPDTGVTLYGYQIPFFKESLELACRLHRYFYGLHSIGWDIAITTDGPIFIEGNEDWDGSIPMSLEKNFKTRFLKMFNKR